MRHILDFVADPPLATPGLSRHLRDDGDHGRLARTVADALIDETFAHAQGQAERFCWRLAVKQSRLDPAYAGMTAVGRLGHANAHRHPGESRDPS